MSQFSLLRKVFEIITDDDFDHGYVQTNLKVDNHLFIILKTTGMSEDFNPSREIEIFKHTKDYTNLFVMEISYTNKDINPKIYLYSILDNYKDKIIDPINIQDYDDTELLILFGNKFTDDIFTKE